MKPPTVDAYVLFSPGPEVLAVFYRGLGLPLEEERHGDGPIHFACELGAVHFAIYPQRKGVPGGWSGRIGFQVSELSRVVERNRPSLVSPIERMPWGLRAIVQDPDGRPEELNQAET